MSHYTVQRNSDHCLLVVLNKIIIPLAVVGYEMINSDLGATRLVDYLSSHIQQARVE